MIKRNVITKEMSETMINEIIEYFAGKINTVVAADLSLMCISKDSMPSQIENWNNIKFHYPESYIEEHYNGELKVAYIQLITEALSYVNMAHFDLETGEKISTPDCHRAAKLHAAEYVRDNFDSIVKDLKCNADGLKEMYSYYTKLYEDEERAYFRTIYHDQTVCGTIWEVLLYFADKSKITIGDKSVIRNPYHVLNKIILPDEESNLTLIVKSYDGYAYDIMNIKVRKEIDEIDGIMYYMLEHYGILGYSYFTNSFVQLINPNPKSKNWYFIIEGEL